MKPVTVIIADDMPHVRQDLRTVLQLAGQASNTPVEILGEAENGSQAVQIALALQPDVVIMDLEMPLLDGFTATRQIKAASPLTKILILTVHAAPEDQSKALQAGADGFLVKGVPVADILHQIQCLAQQGETS